MMQKWSELRPDKNMTKTALATKGKRLFDRASKDLGGKGWLGLDDLNRIKSRIGTEFVSNEINTGPNNQETEPTQITPEQESREETYPTAP